VVIQLEPASIRLTFALAEYFGDWDASLPIVGVRVLHLLHKDLESELGILRWHLTGAIQVVKDIIIVTLILLVLLIWQSYFSLYRYLDGGIPHWLVLVFLSGGLCSKGLICKFHIHITLSELGQIFSS
jgi:hypothetical protein